MSNDWDIVNFVVRHGIFFGRMCSPIGRNAVYCASRFDRRLNGIYFINKRINRSCVQTDLSRDLMFTVVSLLEMLLVKFNYFSMSLFSRSKINHAIHCRATAHLSYTVVLLPSCLLVFGEYLVYEFHNK